MAQHFFLAVMMEQSEHGILPLVEYYTHVQDTWRKLDIWRHLNRRGILISLDSYFYTGTSMGYLRMVTNFLHPIWGIYKF